MSRVTLIGTRGMSVKQWTDAMADRLWIFGPIPRVDRDDEWRAWGANLLNLPSIRGINLPDPYQFSDWRRWADRVVEVFSSIDL